MNCYARRNGHMSSVEPWSGLETEIAKRVDIATEKSIACTFGRLAVYVDSRRETPTFYVQYASFGAPPHRVFAKHGTYKNKLIAWYVALLLCDANDRALLETNNGGRKLLQQMIFPQGNDTYETRMIKCTDASEAILAVRAAIAKNEEVLLDVHFQERHSTVRVHAATHGTVGRLGAIYDDVDGALQSCNSKRIGSVKALYRHWSTPSSQVSRKRRLSDDELHDKLCEIGLGAYHDKLTQGGYVAQAIKVSTAEERMEIARQVNMLPGHAHAFCKLFV